MGTTRLSTKGQIILPKAVRDAHQWGPGTEFLVDEVPEGVLLRPSRVFAASRLADVSGSLRYGGRPRTVAEMRQAITKEVKRRRARGRY